MPVRIRMKAVRIFLMKITGMGVEDRIKPADAIEINEDKIYGVHMEKVNKVLNAFPNFNKNLGVILSGA